MSSSEIHERWKINGEEDLREELLSKGIVGT